MTCGRVAAPVQHTPGSLAIEVVLWLCFLVPGLVYSLWRHSARHDVCASCGGASLLPPDAPVAQGFLAKHGITVAAPAGSARRPSVAAYGAGAALGGLVGRLMRGKGK
jgi:hypothetical protein